MSPGLWTFQYQISSLLHHFILSSFNCVVISTWTCDLQPRVGFVKSQWPLTFNYQTCSRWVSDTLHSQNHKFTMTLNFDLLKTVPKSLFCKVSVALTFDLWPPNFKFSLESKWMCQIWRHMQCSWEWNRRTHKHITSVSLETFPSKYVFYLNNSLRPEKIKLFGILKY